MCVSLHLPETVGNVQLRSARLHHVTPKGEGNSQGKKTMVTRPNGGDRPSVCVCVCVYELIERGGGGGGG